MQVIKMVKVPTINGQIVAKHGTPIHVDQDYLPVTYKAGTPYYRCNCGGFQTSESDDPTCSRCYRKGRSVKHIAR
jgi:hypothetical protein